MPPPRPRDRATTEAAIVAAAGQVLARAGFPALSVQSIATEAGVDRKLVYRYFGGAEGVVEALGGQTDLWLGHPLPPPDPQSTYAATLAGLLHAYVAALRENTTLQRLLAWELTEPSAMLLRLERARSAAIATRLPALRGGHAPPEGVDAPAWNAVLLAAINYLTLRARTAGGFAGIDLATPEGWQRIEAVLDQIIESAYAVRAPGLDEARSGNSAVNIPIAGKKEASE